MHKGKEFIRPGYVTVPYSFNSLSIKQARMRASRTFQNKLAGDPRYEVVDGEYRLKVEVVIIICKENVDFFLSRISDFQDSNNLIVTSYKQLLKALTNKIKKDHC